MGELNNYKDMYYQGFDVDSHNDFLATVASFDEDTQWHSTPLKGISFAPISSVAREEIIAPDEAFDDSLSRELPICAIFPDGNKYLVRDYLLKSIKQHHRDGATVLGDMLTAGAYDEFCDHLNMGRKYLKKNLLWMMRGGKIGAWASDFNHNWSQTQQITYFEERMREAFPRFEFNDGAISHFYTNSAYRLDCNLDSYKTNPALDMDDSVMNAYSEAWKSAGLSEEHLRAAVPVCYFITGESGLTSIEVRPALQIPGQPEIPLGKSLAVNHRGEDKSVWDRFTDFPSQTAVMYQKGLTGLKDLCERTIFNPYCCTTQILSTLKSSVPVKDLKDCASCAEIFWPRDEKIACHAIDIFNLINEMVSNVNKSLSPVRRLRNMEMVARLLYCKWDDFDVDQPAKLGGSARKTDDDFGI